MHSPFINSKLSIFRPFETKGCHLSVIRVTDSTFNSKDTLILTL